MSATRRNLQSFLGTMAAHGSRGGFARATSARRFEKSFEETLALAGSAAASLRSAGVRSGDRVLLLHEDGPLWVSAFAACLATGAVAVPLEPGSPQEFVRDVAGRSRAKAMLHDGAARELGLAGPMIDLVALGPGDPAGLYPLADPDPSDLAEIVFTSGTTAAPRGVMITHANILVALEGIERGILARRKLWRPFSPLTFVSLVPLSHLFGQTLGLFIPAILGARVVFASSRPPRALFELAKRERAWVMVTVPRHLAGLREYASQKLPPRAGPPRQASNKWWLRAWRSRALLREHGWRLRAFVVGGARLDPDLERWFKDLGYFVVQGYGLTETAPIISVSNPFDDRVGLLGRPTRAQQVRFAADGEILVRGGNVTPGYFEDDAATKAAFDGEWLRTGDLGALEADGSIRFLGRKKEIIVTAEGQNVFPDEVEAALRRQEAIADACVVGIQGAKGEEVHAAIMATADSSGVPSAVAAANDTLAPHQRIRSWTLWPDLDFPRTGTGKVLRRVVAASVIAEGSPREPGSADSSTADRGPLASLRNLAGAGARGDQRLGAELGLSSIDIAELAAEIEERYQVEIDPARIHDDASLDELIESAASRVSRESLWPMPRWARRAPFRLARELIQSAVAFPTLKLFVRLDVTGRENLVKLGPPFLLVANHASHLDVPVLLAALPRRLRRRMAVAMQPEYFEAYFRKEGPRLRRLERGWHYTLVTFLLHTFPFPRSAAFRIARDYAGEMADAGWSILVFPEGELSGDGAMHDFRPGVGILARDLALPVVPARIRGLFEVLPRGGRFPKGIRRPVSVMWGEPIKMIRGEEPEAFARRVEGALGGM